MSKISRKKRIDRQEKGRAHRSVSRRSQVSKRPDSASYQPSPFSEESRKKRERERRRSLFLSKKPLILLSIVAAILVIVTLLFLLPGFTIDAIQVSGAYRLNEQNVEAQLSHHMGEHFLYKMGGNLKAIVGLRYAKEEEALLASSPLLNSVAMYFSYPSKLKVDLNEKIEVMCVRVPGGYALVDKDLTVLELTEEAPDIFPSVEQITLINTVTIGEKLQTDQTERLQKSINITAELIRSDSGKGNNRQLLPLIRHIVWQDTNTFFLHIPSTQGGMIRVKLDDNRYLQDKFALLSDLVFVESFLDKPAGELDMTGLTVHFRPDMS
ncbi:MAG: hypothetical protein PHR78_05975 [Eubacteriales bacterium]|nr:hypothetical protein [Eubacteriales bacterium]MDD4541686.1 hypothetical protein [Eubacteriales bacterium]